MIAVAAGAASPASAATTDATISEHCWLHVYPPDTTCAGEFLGIGFSTSFGQSISSFGADFNVPTNALVSKATLRFDLDSNTMSTYDAQLAFVTGGFDWASTTFQTFDTSNISDPLVTFDVQPEAVDVTTVIQDLLAKGETFARFAVWSPEASDDPSRSEYAIFDDVEIEIEYDVACPSNPYAAASGTSETIVRGWNEQLMARIRDVSTTDPIRQSPTWVSRAAAMLNVGIFDTFNSVYFAKLESLATGTPTDQVCGWESYLTLADTPASTNANLAAGYAAKAILESLYPDKTSEITTAFNAIQGNPSYNATAYALGDHVADVVIAARTNDGAGVGSYSPAFSTPGAWRPSPMGTSGTCPGAVTPQWGNVTPFAMNTGSQYRPPLPGGYTAYSSLLASTLYANDAIEVKDKGRYPRSSSTRTLDEEDAAWFWANDLDTTYKPPGQLLQHTWELVDTQAAAKSSGDPVEFFRTWSREGLRVARLYAEVSLAMADSGIAAWDAKYNTPIDLWRPVDAIRLGDTDGNASTPDIDTWEPLSRTTTGVQFSPCFPAWISGHATFGGTWSRVMENEFAFADDHTDPFPLTLSTEDPHLPVNNRLRAFDSFAEAAEENAESRIWLGVHYRIDAEGGLYTGRAVASNVTQKKLRPIKTCASWGCATTIP